MRTVYICQVVFAIFWTKIEIFLNTYPDLPHSQGVWNLPHKLGKFRLYLIIKIPLKQWALKQFNKFNKPVRKTGSIYSFVFIYKMFIVFLG